MAKGVLMGDGVVGEGEIYVVWARLEFLAYKANSHLAYSDLVVL